MSWKERTLHLRAVPVATTGFHRGDRGDRGEVSLDRAPGADKEGCLLPHAWIAHPQLFPCPVESEQKTNQDTFLA